MLAIIDRPSLLRASAIIDMLELGWIPGDAELTGARQLTEWVILPSGGSLPYRIMGIVRDRTKNPVFIATAIAIGPDLRWACIWDEWIVLGNRAAESAKIEAEEVRRMGAIWLLEELKRVSSQV